MGTKEELKERAGDCQVTEDYINVVTDIISGIGDKDWALEVLEEGAEWAGTADEFLQFAGCAVEVLGNKEKGAD